MKHALDQDKLLQLSLMEIGDTLKIGMLKVDCVKYDKCFMCCLEQCIIKDSNGNNMHTEWSGFMCPCNTNSNRINEGRKMFIIS